MFYVLIFFLINIIILLSLVEVKETLVYECFINKTDTYIDKKMLEHKLHFLIDISLNERHHGAVG